MFDFGALPPEINSGRMYAGPGSGSLMAASAVWDEVAAELAVAASGYGSVIAELTSGPWVGPASSSMVAAVMPFVSWLSAMSGLAEETASQGRAAAAAFEAAFAMTVPPPVIAANRVLLATLVATNFFGQNTPAIMATEAQYLEMWAQDAAAMYGYAAASATASQLAPFEAPPNTTTPDGSAEQALAVTQAAQQPAANTAQTVSNATAQLGSAPGLSSASSQTVAQTTSSAAALAPASSVPQITPTDPWWWQLSPGNYDTVLKRMTGLPYFSNGIVAFWSQLAQQLVSGPGGSTAGAFGAWYPTPQFASLGLGNLGSLSSNVVSAGAGQAAQVGGLSVPQQWATLASAVSPANAAEAEAFPIQAGVTNPPGNALLRGMPTGVIGRRAGAAAGYSHKYGFRYSVLTRPPSAG